MLIDEYFAAVDDLFQTVRTTQRENIIKAGVMMADAMCEGRNIIIHDSGHIINAEMIQRSGGLQAPQQLSFYLHTENKSRIIPEKEPQKIRSMEGLAEMAFRVGNIYDGDLMIIGSVSGRAEQLVDLAYTAKYNHKCQIIALTSLPYSMNVKSCHSSGLKLYEIADLVIDNCAPLGDAMMTIEGLDMPFAPASGLSAAHIMWSVYAACIEEMLKRGIKPSILKSSNTPGGDEYNLEMEYRYKEFGY